MRRSALIALLLVTSCTGEAPGARRDAIVGGEPAPTETSVFFLDNDAGCSATLIAPRTLLTAAHCLEPLPTAATNAPRLEPDAGWYRVVAHRSYAEFSDGGVADLALVLLDREPPVTPRAWAWWGPVPAIGSGVRHVGFGRTETAPPGERREVSTVVLGAVVDRSRGLVLASGAPGRGICFGDSGGAALTPTDAGERLTAVHSFITTDCGAGVSSSVVIAPYRRFIEAWLAVNEAASCARDGRCVTACALEDPDCRCGRDGVCQAFCPEGDDPDCPGDCGLDGACAPRATCPGGDPDCITDGQACLAGGQCAGGACISDPQNPTRYCSQPCSATQACPATLQCDAARSLCLLPQLPVVQEGAPCDATVKCPAGAVCESTGSEKRCLRVCSSQAQCLTGTRCRFGVVNVCMPMEPVQLEASPTSSGPLAPACSTTPTEGLAVLAMFALLARRLRHRTGATPRAS